MRPAHRSLVSALLLALCFSLCLSLTAGIASARQLDFAGTAQLGDVYDLRGLAFSPDGRHAYTLGDRASVLAVDESSGELRLTFVSHIDLPDYPLSDDREIVVSPDGSKVYISRILHFGGIPSSIDSHYELLVYRRAVDSGRLTLLDRHRIDRRTFLLTPDGTRAYWTNEGGPLCAFRTQPHGLDPLWRLDADELTGGEVDDLITNIHSDPNGDFLYGLFSENRVGVLRPGVEAETPELIQLLDLGEGFPNLGGLDDFVTTADGRLMLGRTSPYSPAPGLVTLFADGATGQLAAGGLYQSVGDPEDPLWVVVSPDDRFVIVLWEGPFPGGPPHLSVYERGDVAGGLSPVQSLSLDGLTRSIDEPRFSPSGRSLLLPTSSRLWSVPWAHGELTGPPTMVTVDDDDIEFYASRMVAPAGSSRVYTSSFATPMRIFRMTPGGLEYETSVDGSFGSLAASPDGKHLYAASQNRILAFEIGSGSGLPEHEIQTFEFDLPTFASLGQSAFTGDGRWLISVASERLTLFERDPATGLITERDTVENGDAGFELSGVTMAAVSPDSRHVYAVVQYQNSMVTFDLDVSTGKLTPKDTVVDPLGDSTFQYLTTASVLPDGRHLVVGGSNRILVYARDPGTGALDLLQTLPRYQVGSVVALPDGNSVLVTHRDRRTAISSSDYLFELFQRDATTGQLDLLEVLDPRDYGVEGLGRTVVVDPEGPTLYSGGTSGRIAVVDLGGDGPCQAGLDRLCLGGERFEVRVDWRDFEGNTGSARVAPVRTEDSGVLWFFSEDNWEMQVKVLDACDLNGHFWLFAASATTVETTMTVTDLFTGAERTYFNPLGRAAPAITDTEAFRTCSSPVGGSSVLGEQATARHPVQPMTASTLKTTADRVDVRREAQVEEKFSSVCSTSSVQACLGTRPIGGQRFAVEVEWRDGAGNTGFGRATQGRTDDSVLFWFFGPENWELMVKVLDGCGINDRYWVLSAATTDVEYTLRITDQDTGEVREYVNPLGTAASAVADIDAFGSCPS